MMGYRLDVYSKDKTINFYGTKFYGYMFIYSQEGKEIFPSCKYLYDIGKLQDRVRFEDGSYPEFELTKEEFERFITLYAKEYMDHYGGDPADNILEDDDIKKLLAYDGSKIVSWC